jgi:hypothetical protein
MASDGATPPFTTPSEKVGSPSKSDGAEVKRMLLKNSSAGYRPKD